MGEFYNKGRTPTSATMRNGGTVCFSPRVWQHVPFAEESSGSIQTLVRKGFLARRDSKKDHVVAAEVVGPAPVVVEVPVIVAPMVPIEAKIEVIASPNSGVPEEVEIEKEVDAEVAIEESSGTESLTRSRSSRRR
jgi:hypothetical protein